MAKQDNLAYAIRNIEAQELPQVKEPHIKKLEKSTSVSASAVRKSSVLKATLGLAYILVLCVALVFSRVSLAEQNSELLAAQSTLENLEMDYTRMSLEVESMYSLKSIEKIAKETYGMVKPEQDQITYLQVQKENKIEIAEQENDLFSQISRFFDRLKEYISG